MAQISHIYPPYIDSLDKPDFYSHHLHIIGSLLTSVFLWALSQEVGIINFLPGNSLPFLQYNFHNTATCAINFNVASGQGPGYWDNIMDPVGTRSWSRSWTRLKIDDEDISLLYKHFFKHSLLVHES